MVWQVRIFCEENAEKALLPIMDKLVGAIKVVAEEATGILYPKETSKLSLFITSPYLS